MRYAGVLLESIDPDVFVEYVLKRGYVEVMAGDSEIYTYRYFKRGASGDTVNTVDVPRRADASDYHAAILMLSNGTDIPIDRIIVRLLEATAIKRAQKKKTEVVGNANSA